MGFGYIPSIFIAFGLGMATLAILWPWLEGDDDEDKGDE